jgi:hypothetical protein
VRSVGAIELRAESGRERPDWEERELDVKIEKREMA